MTTDNAHQNAPTKPRQCYDPEKDLFQFTSVCGLSNEMSVAPPEASLAFNVVISPVKVLFTYFFLSEEVGIS